MNKELKLGTWLILAMLLSGYCKGRAQGCDASHETFDRVVQAHVRDGLVDYKALKADPDALDRYLSAVAAVPKATFTSWSTPQQLAFLINLYNAATLKLITAHYPVQSIKDIGNFLRGPWDRPVVVLFGDKVTLNHLEHDLIRREYHEPRIHMALVCAAKGCPRLRSEAYVGARLDEQLDDQSTLYLRSPAGLRIERSAARVYLSAIFKWYGEDFADGYAEAVKGGNFDQAERGSLGFVHKHVKPVDQVYLAAGHYRLGYLDYDWSLNEMEP